jgi:hypothetical protein
MLREHGMSDQEMLYCPAREKPRALRERKIVMKLTFEEQAALRKLDPKRLREGDLRLSKLVWDIAEARERQGILPTEMAEDIKSYVAANVLQHLADNPPPIAKRVTMAPMMSGRRLPMDTTTAVSRMKVWSNGGKTH